MKLILNFIQLNLDLDGFTLTQEQFPHLLTTTKNKCFILSVFYSNSRVGWRKINFHFIITVI